MDHPPPDDAPTPLEPPRAWVHPVLPFAFTGAVMLSLTRGVDRANSAWWGGTGARAALMFAGVATLLVAGLLLTWTLGRRVPPVAVFVASIAPWGFGAWRAHRDLRDVLAASPSVTGVLETRALEHALLESLVPRWIGTLAASALLAATALALATPRGAARSPSPGSRVGGLLAVLPVFVVLAVASATHGVLPAAAWPLAAAVALSVASWRARAVGSPDVPDERVRVAVVAVACGLASFLAASEGAWALEAFADGYALDRVTGASGDLVRGFADAADRLTSLMHLAQRNGPIAALASLVLYAAWLTVRARPAPRMWGVIVVPLFVTAALIVDDAYASQSPSSPPVVHTSRADVEPRAHR